MTQDLTTAESLILELVIAKRLLGFDESILSSRLWIKPQLESLHHRGLLASWGFDDQGDFKAVPSELALSQVSTV